MATVEIPLSGRRGAGLVTIIDEESLALASRYRWHLSDGYACSCTPDGKNVRLHRLIVDAPSGSIVDHRDRNRLNNIRENLRICTPTESSRNVSPIQGTSRYKGVCWNKSRQEWRAHIAVQKRVKFLGCFGSEEEAAHAYDRAARELFGEFAYLNFP